MIYRSSSPDLGSTRPVNNFGTRLEHFETSYVEYLEHSRQNIAECMYACQCWSAAYDGEDPPPDALATIDSPSTEGTISPEQETSPGHVNFPNLLSSTPKKSDLPDLGESPQDSGVCMKAESSAEPSELMTDSCDNVECSTSNSGGQEGLLIQSHGQSPSLEISILSDATDSDCKGSPRSPLNEQCKNSPRGGTTDDKLTIIPETARTNAVGRDSYAESVTSEADSALSGSSCATDNAGGSGDTAGSRSDSPLNDNFQAQEFNAFLLNLKRVKTPVEFCDNMEDSLCEMDALIQDLRQASPPSSREHASSLNRSPRPGNRERDSSLTKSQDALPEFTASHNSSQPILIKPCANHNSLPVTTKCDSPAHHATSAEQTDTPTAGTTSPPVGSPGTLKERLSEFESERSVKPKLDSLPRRNSSVSDNESRSGSLSAFCPPRAALAAHRYSFGSPNIGQYM